jgi:tetratricopeptide (TPR) repeat protein
VAAAAWLAPAGLQAAQPQALRPVLVMPFESDSTQSRTYWLGEGVSLLVIEELGALGARVLTRDQRAQTFDDLHLPDSPGLSRATVIRVGQLIAASHVVFGTVALDGGVLTARSRSLVLDEGRLGPEVVESGPPGELFAVCRRLARRLAPQIVVGAAADRRPAPEVSLDAYEAFVKGIVAERPEIRDRLLRAAVARAPGYDRALLGLWAVQTELGQHEEALASARSVLVESPRYAQSRFATALSLIELRQLDDAYATLSALSASWPEAPVFNNLGVVQLRRGATPQSGLPVAYFNRAAEIDPDDPDHFFNLGYAYLLDRDPSTAVYWLRQAVRRDPADGDAHYVLAAALQGAGQSAEAARERELARRLSSKYDEWDRRRPQPADPVPHGLERLKGTLDPVHTVRFDRAILAAERDQREMTGFYVDRARRLFDQGKDGEALTDLRRALFLSPYDARALLLVARLHLRSGHPGEAADAARVSLWSEDGAAGHVILGRALLELKDMPGARAAAERALALDATSAEARDLLTRIDAGAPR